MRKYLFWQIFFPCILMVSGTCRANSLLIGQISFDASGTGNSFDLYNLTSGLSNPSGVADNLLFGGTLTITVSGAGQHTYSFNGIDSLVTGIAAPTIVELPLGYDITSATLALTLSSSTGVNIFDDGGSLSVANLLAVSNVQLPILSGTSLSPCDPQGDPCSQATIYVDTAPNASAVPEPSTFWLVTSAVGVATTLSRRRFRA